MNQETAGGSQQWKRLTAERKFEVYRATRGEKAPVGEILRKAGLTLEDLRQIEETIEESAIAGLKARSRSARYSHRKVSSEEYEQLVEELREKEKALAELSVEFTLLKKKDRLASKAAREKRLQSRSGRQSS